MKVDLPYGASGQSFRVPDDVKVDYLVPSEGLAIEDPSAALEEALEHPIEAQPLAGLVNSRSKIAVLVSDLTRGSGSLELLVLLVEHLKRASVPAQSMRIIIARGTHRKLLKEEKAVFKRKELIGTVLEEHDCDDASSMSALVLTSRGTPVRVNRHIREADLVILLSSISFHYFAGFGGGRKLILPGCSDRQSIMANHRLALLDTVPVKLNPLAAPGMLDGNPVHEDMCEAMGALENLFSVNFFTDTTGKIAFINSGDARIAHAEACEEFAKVYSIPVERKYGVLLLSAGGYPYDMNLLQSHKALRQTARAVREGGTILFFAGCSEGVGSEMLASALDKPKERFMKEAYKQYDLNNQSALSLHDLSDSFEIRMVTELADRWMEDCGIKRCSNIEAFIADALTQQGTDEIAVISFGGKVLCVEGKGVQR